MTRRSPDTESFDPAVAMGAKSRNAAWFRVLRRLESGARALPAIDGYAIGGFSVPVTVIRDLARHDMVESVATAGGPAYVISPPGRALLRRIAATGREGLQPNAKGEARRRTRSGHGLGPQADTPDTYRAQHLVLETESGSGRGDGPVVVNRAESPLGWLRHRKDRTGKPFLSEAQFEAGEAMRRDFEMAGMTPRLTTDLSGRPAGDRHSFTGRGLTPTERQVAAKQRLDRALEAVGPDLSDVVLRVCCFLEGIEAAERALGWPTRSGKLVLGIALDRLVRHYGLG
jgi:hypothetical protein